MKKRIKSAICILMALILVVSVVPFSTIKAKAAAGTIDDFVERCYTVTLGRGSDPDGFADWKGQLLNGDAVGVHVAYGFLFSSEYTQKNKSPEEYVTDLYMLFMGREPDEAGYADWVGQLKDGKSRVEVFAGFANSQEFYNICDNYGITAGRYVIGYDRTQVNDVNLFVERLYKVCFGRIGDIGGQKNWVEKLLNKQITGSECARSFIQSQEYENLGLSDSDYVENLYIALMGRASDAEGKTNWLNGLANGMTRDEVFAGFVNSVEFDGICKKYNIDRGSYTATKKGTYDPNNPNNVPSNPSEDNPSGDIPSGDTPSGDVPQTHTHNFNQKNTDIKYLKSAATCTSKAVYYYSCECGEYDKSKTFTSGNTLAHNFNKKNTDSKYLKSKATCTEIAVYYYSCECGEYDKNKTFSYGKALGHEWDEGVVTEEATEESEGIKTYTCTREGCSATKTESIPKKEHVHNFDLEDIDSKYLKKAATCTEEAEYYYSCKCGEYDTSNYFIIEDSALGHEWDDGVVTVEATEELEGEKTYTCTREGCNATKTESIPKKEHVHSYTQKNTDSKYLKKAATCTEDAEYYYSCKCGEYYINGFFTLEDSALGHEWNEGTINKKATLYEEGSKICECTRPGCNETKIEIIPCIADRQVGDVITFGQYEQDGDETNGKEDIEWEIMSIEDGRLFVVSRYVLDCREYHDKRDAVTWETSSLRKWLNDDFYEDSFSENEKERIPSVLIENKDNPYTGVAGGNDTLDRIFCLSIEELEAYFGESKWSLTIPIQEDNFVLTNNQNYICEPTQYAINKGVKSSVITAEFYQEHHLALRGQTEDVIGLYGTYWWLRSPSGYPICAACLEDNGDLWYGDAEAFVDYGVRPAMYISINEIITHDYSIQNNDNKYLKSAATCTSPAIYYYSCECGEYSRKNTFTFGEALGHEWDEGVVTIEATEELEGEKTFTCTREGCNATKTESIPKKEHVHDFNQENIAPKYLKKAATCTEDAEYYYSCVCGDYDSISTFIIENTALGHEWDEGIVTIKPTVEREGERTYTCTREGCNATKTESIPKRLPGIDYDAPIIVDFSFGSEISDDFVVIATDDLCGAYRGALYLINKETEEVINAEVYDYGDGKLHGNLPAYKIVDAGIFDIYKIQIWDIDEKCGEYFGKGYSEYDSISEDSKLPESIADMTLEVSAEEYGKPIVNSITINETILYGLDCTEINVEIKEKDFDARSCAVMFSREGDNASNSFCCNLQKDRVEEDSVLFKGTIKTGNYAPGIYNLKYLNIHANDIDVDSKYYNSSEVPACSFEIKKGSIAPIRKLEIDDAELTSPCKTEISAHIIDYYTDWDNWEEKHQMIEDAGEWIELYSLELSFYNIEKGTSKQAKATKIERSLDANGNPIPNEWDATFELNISEKDQKGTYFINFINSDRWDETFIGKGSSNYNNFPEYRLSEECANFSFTIKVNPEEEANLPTIDVITLGKTTLESVDYTEISVEITQKDFNAEECKIGFIKEGDNANYSYICTLDKYETNENTIIFRSLIKSGINRAPGKYNLKTVSLYDEERNLQAYSAAEVPACSFEIKEGSISPIRTIEINNAELISPCKEEITVHIKDIFNDWDNWEEKHQFVEDEVDGEYEQYSLDLRFYNIEKGVSKLFKATEIERSLDANGELIPYEWDAIFELDINDVDQTGTYFIDYVYSDRWDESFLGKGNYYYKSDYYYSLPEECANISFTVIVNPEEEANLPTIDVITLGKTTLESVDYTEISVEITKKGFEAETCEIGFIREGDNVNYSYRTTLDKYETDENTIVFKGLIKSEVDRKSGTYNLKTVYLYDEGRNLKAYGATEVPECTFEIKEGSKSPIRTIEIDDKVLIGPCKAEITVHLKDLYVDWDNWEEKHQFVEDEVDGEYELYSLDLVFHNERNIRKIAKANKIERSLDANGEMILYEWDVTFELDINENDQSGTYSIDYVSSDRWDQIFLGKTNINYNNNYYEKLPEECANFFLLIN